MKSTTLLIIGFIFFTGTLFGQNNLPVINSADYAQLKKDRKLPSKFILQPKYVSRNSNLIKYSTDNNNNRSTSASGCNCMMPIDSTFNVVPFDTLTTGEGAPDYRNDDESSPLISLPFSFCFYGTNFDSCFINNNGNITFNKPLAEFSAGGFPAGTDTVMVAPFWGDVDTRGPGSGLVYYKITPTALIVRWQSVGYFIEYDDLLNDFQLIITNGSDPLLPGNNVQFCYGDMQWTTGDASDGVGGFGGVPATVGVNKGDSINFIQFGRFDLPDSTYDGPFGNSDGISWLDNQLFSFNTCVSGGSNNIPPILSSSQTCDTLNVCIGDTLLFNASFFSPEEGQTTTVSISAPGVNGFSVINATPGNTASITAQLIADAANVGVVALNLIGTDDGVPVQSTATTVYVGIYPKSNPSFTVSPMPFVYLGEPITLTNTSSNCVNYSWDFGDSTLASTQKNPTHTYASTGEYTITLTGTSVGGCVSTYSFDYTVVDDVKIPNVFTPNNGGNSGLNQFFYIKNLDFFVPASLTIFNRWGNKVYESSDYQNNWNGGNNSDGVYYYILSAPQLKSIKYGFVQILR